MLSPGMRQAANVSNTTASQIESQFAKMQGGSKRMTASVDELKARLEAVNRVKFGTTMEHEFRVASRAAKQLESQIDKLEGNAQKKMGGMGGFVKGSLIADGIQQIAGLVTSGIGDVYQTGLKNSSLRTAINATTGGRGTEAIAQTASIADKYGLNYEASLEGVKTLTGGLKSMNMPLREQMKIFEGVSTGMAAMQLSADDAKGAMLALGQMASKGKVAAEELRGQLGERVPGAFSIAARAMGMNEAAFNKALESGNIYSKEFLPRFAAEMQKTFGADALAAATGPQAIQERFNNAIYNMKTELADGFMPMITPMIQGFTEMAVTWLPMIKEWLAWTRDIIAAAVTEVNNLLGGTGSWNEYIAMAQNLFNSTWITLKSLGANLWHIVKGVVEWVKTSELLKDIVWAVGKLFDGIYYVIRQIGNAIVWVWDTIIKPILDAIEWVYGKIKGLFTGGKTTVEIVDGTKGAAASSVMQPNGTPSVGLGAFAMPVTFAKAPIKGVDPLSLASSGNSQVGALSTGGGEDMGKKRSSDINTGGQRVITINMQRALVETINMNVTEMKEGAQELEAIVMETLKRVLYSINGEAATA